MSKYREISEANHYDLDLLDGEEVLGVYENTRVTNPERIWVTNLGIRYRLRNENVSIPYSLIEKVVWPWKNKEHIPFQLPDVTGSEALVIECGEVSFGLELDPIDTDRFESDHGEWIRFLGRLSSALRKVHKEGGVISVQST